MSRKIEIFDTTLRDGAQSAGVSFSVRDKIKVLEYLDRLGFTYSECGNPANTETDYQLFSAIKDGKVKLSSLVPVAFNSTCREGVAPEDDERLVKAASLACGYITICGKSSLFQVINILRTTKEENLRMISQSVSYCVSKELKVFFDAEHYFDGFVENPDYALECVKAALNAGAFRIILCDTNGGSMPEQTNIIVKKTLLQTGADIGIHCHNDCGLAVANTITAVNSGAMQIQGTICGIGERCGNTNLCTVIPDLQLKLGYDLLSEDLLTILAPTSRKIADVCNLIFNEREPYVGGYAFSHKAGTHIDGVTKLSSAFEHIKPQSVGNRSSLLLSEYAGKAAVWEKIRQFEPSIEKNDPRVNLLLERIKAFEHDGLHYENAEGSLELLILELLGKKTRYFELLDFKTVLGDPASSSSKTSAMMKIAVDGKILFAADEGDGPVNAMDKTLRKGLMEFYPLLSEMKLIDYKVRVIDSNAATAAKVRVSIDSADSERAWRTCGVSADIIKASWIALCDSINLKLAREERETAH